MGRRSLPLRTRLGLFLVSATVPLVVLLVVQNWYAMELVHHQVAEAERRLLKRSMAQVDSSLSDLDKYLSKMIAVDQNLLVLDQGSSGDDHELAKIQVQMQLSTDSTLFPSLGAFFYYAPGTDEMLLAQGLTVVRLSPEEREVVRQSIVDLSRNRPGRWVVRNHAGRDRLLRLLRVDSGYLGAWIDVESILKPWEQEIAGQGGHVLLLDPSGNPHPPRGEVEANSVSIRAPSQGYAISGKPTPYLVIAVDSSVGEFRLVSLIPDRVILQSIPALGGLNALVTAAVILVIIAFFLFLQRTVLRPMNLLSRAMERLEAGDMSARVISARSGREFDQVHATFNSMVAQIHNLRIHVYEEQINAQQSELLSLRLQINPHFFLNSLNILYQLAQVNNVVLVRKLTLDLSRYFQFLFRSSAHEVAFRDEWDHVRTYLRIQELRFPKLLRVRLLAPDPLPFVLVPPLVIQPFVENAVQYARGPDGSLSLELEARVTPDGVLRITISDDGPGVSEDQLQALNSETARGSDGQHIGFTNVRRRLFLLYAHRARLQAHRRPGQRGLVVTVEIPLPARAAPPASTGAPPG